ncbi:MAG: dihydroorotate dehydrogenase [Candidatus Micrarchaeota archaeon]|nr:dihydroorotate dehydrogenase [Candidatus Micrarchaeota archaeon]
MIDLTTTLCGIKLSNPLVLASGVKGTDKEMLIRIAKEGAGAVTSKSCSLEPREGHENPTVLDYKYYLINAVGLSNPGVEEEIKELEYAIKNCPAPVIVSIYENSVERFVLLAKKIEKIKPVMIELDASCPNVKGKLFCSCASSAAELVSAVKKEVKIPISIKLSAAVADIGQIAKECQDAGADCITAINTIPCMAIDVWARKPILTNKYGGLSGQAIFPIALRAVNQIREYCTIPIIGGGGVYSGEDAAAMLMAGANAVSVGSALYRYKFAFRKIKRELIEYMRKMNFEKISDIKFA